MTSANYLAMFGVPAQLGRVYLPSDGRTDIVVLGERTWRTRFGSDPSIVGRTVMLSGRPFEVLGVMPRGFRGARGRRASSLISGSRSICRRWAA